MSLLYSIQSLLKDPPPEFALVVGTQRNRGGLEMGLVVVLEAAHDHGRHHMVVEVRGDITDPDLGMAKALAAP